MAKDKVRVEGFERVDIQDFQAVAKDQLEEQERQLFASFITDPAKQQLWIIDGFQMDNPSGRLLSVTKGRALLAAREGSTAKPGMLVTEGTDVLTVDLNTYAPAIYNIYIRFESIAGEYQTRIFWNPDGTGSEFGRSVPTRYVAGWAMRVETSSPGIEWLKIGEVYIEQPGYGDFFINDLRQFFFEGSYVGDGVFKLGWGSAADGGTDNDRDADRMLYGVKDLRTFVGATLKCIEDIKGQSWYERAIMGMNIGFDDDPSFWKLSIRDENFHLSFGNFENPHLGFDTGDSFEYDRTANAFLWKIGSVTMLTFNASSIYPGTDGGVALGSSSYRFGDIWISGALRNNGADIVVNPGGAFAFRPSTASGADLGTATYPWKSLALDTSGTDGFGVASHLYPTYTNNFYVGSDTKRFHTFFGSYFDLKNSTEPALYFRNTNGAVPVNQGRWRSYVDSAGTFILRAVNDAGADGSAALQFYRSSTSILKATIGSDQIGLGVNHDGGGASVQSYQTIMPYPGRTVDLGTVTYPWTWLYAAQAKIISPAADAVTYFWMRNTNVSVPTHSGQYVFRVMNTGEFVFSGAADYGTPQLRIWNVKRVPVLLDPKLNLMPQNSGYIGLGGENLTNRGIEVFFDMCPAAGYTGLSLGDATYPWAKLGLSNAVGYGCVTDFVPANDGTQWLGNSLSRWKVYAKTLTVSSDSSEGVASHLLPTSNNYYDLGQLSPVVAKWKTLYVVKVQTDYLDSISGQVYVVDQLIPSGTVNIGSPTYSFSHIYASYFAADVEVSSPAYYGGTMQLTGDMSADDIHANGQLSMDDAGTTATKHVYDLYDDLAMVDQYQPTGEVVTVTKNGKDWQVQVARNEDVPWPLKTASGKGIDLRSTVDFFLSVIKQLHAKVKALEARAEA